ncbi:hypothetical protein LOTGIDRAFT_228617 [Lottia gigantea]|uniref:Uncharacterized protein n=1 Tax=Lottia gigantea TaxID=225164 RepID=V3ZR38_LOTGI|nr:hypothetical protein LOTGIDRAFT_228617 [Lottia gigantea]ESO93863.1 hypothetical protein LOTGIDRAFT_228617 [Lottia gigantea]
MAFVYDRQSLASAENNDDNCDTIDYTNLGPRFKKHLEYAYLRACGADRKKCADALKAVGKAEERIQKRPHTAMPVLENDIGSDGFKSPYATTYKKQYPYKQHQVTIATRPMTTGTSFAPHKPMNHNTHYDEEYARKNPNPNHYYRTGTASGNRSNKPHPSKQFLTWRFPTNLKPPQRDMAREHVTDAKLNDIHRRLCRSTYQSDYLGMPQGYEIVQNDLTNSSLMVKPPHTLDTFQRSTYQQPLQQEILKLSTSRYGTNGRKHIPVYGTIPLTNGNRLLCEKRTTYDRHYNHNTGSPYNVNNLTDNLDSCGIFDENNLETVPPRLLTSGLRKSRSIVPDATPFTSFTPQPVIQYHSVIGSNIRYHSEIGANIRYHSEVGANIRYHSEIGANIRYHSEGGANIRYNSEGGANIRYHSEVGANIRYHSEGGANIRYHSEGGANIRYHSEVRACLRYSEVRACLRYSEVRACLRYSEVRACLRYSEVRACLRYHSEASLKILEPRWISDFDAS